MNNVCKKYQIHVACRLQRQLAAARCRAGDLLTSQLTQLALTGPKQ